MKFVPRLGLNATGMEIHPHKPSLFLVSFKDNSFKIVDSSNYKARTRAYEKLSDLCWQVTLSVYGITAPLLRERQLQEGWCYAVQPGTGYLVLPIDGCSVQFYDLAQDKHIAKLQVS